MSFAVWLSWFEAGQPKPMPTSLIKDLFGPAVVENDSARLGLHYGPFDTTELLMRPDAGGYITGLTVHRPCSAAPFWSALASLLQDPHAVCYWPESGPVVGTAEALANLPTELISLGPPALASTGAELQDLVSGASSKRGPATRCS